MSLRCGRKGRCGLCKDIGRFRIRCRCHRDRYRKHRLGFGDRLCGDRRQRRHPLQAASVERADHRLAFTVVIEYAARLVHQLSQGGVAVNVTINQILNNTSGLVALTASLAVETAARIASNAALSASIILLTSKTIVTQSVLTITTQSGNTLYVHPASECTSRCANYRGASAGTPPDLSVAAWASVDAGVGRRAFEIGWPHSGLRPIRRSR